MYKLYIMVRDRKEIRCQKTRRCAEKKEGGKKIIYHGIIGKSRRANQGALSDYFLPYHPKWWKRRGVNYQAAADCQPGILMVIIGGASDGISGSSYLSHYRLLSRRPSEQINGALSPSPFYRRSESSSRDRNKQNIKMLHESQF